VATWNVDRLVPPTHHPRPPPRARQQLLRLLTWGTIPFGALLGGTTGKVLGLQSMFMFAAAVAALPRTGLWWVNETTMRNEGNGGARSMTRSASPRAPIRRPPQSDFQAEAHTALPKADPLRPARPHRQPLQLQARHETSPKADSALNLTPSRPCMVSCLSTPIDTYVLVAKTFFVRPLQPCALHKHMRPDGKSLVGHPRHLSV